MILYYKSAAGQAEFSDSELHVIEITGLGLPQRSYNEIEYYGQDGIVTVNEKLSSRIIGIKFDLGGGLLTQRTKNMIRILSLPGDLFIICGMYRRKIHVTRTAVDDFIDNRCIRTFIATLTCDSPFFNDFLPVTKKCYSISGGIKYENGAWTLGTSDAPVMWGQCISDIIIENAGGA